MGRKIPAKKHRGVKDPLVQQAKRLQSLKSKINAPPKDPDEQPVPRSLTRLFEFQNKHKEDKTSKKNKKLKRLEHAKGQNNHNASGVGDNPISRLRKLPGETGRDFSLRINSAVKALHNPLEDLDYPQDLMEEDDEKGARMAAQRERRARKKKRAQKEAGEQEPQPTRTQRLAAKKQHKKQKALEAQQDKREFVYERVAFGDVCSAPPVLSAPRRAARGGAAREGAARPGRRDLLLARLLAPRAAPAPPAELQRRERARVDAVAAYRALRRQQATAARGTRKRLLDHTQCVYSQ